MGDYTPRPSSTRAIDDYVRQVRHVADVERAVTVLDTFVVEIANHGFSQVARAEGAAAFAEAFGLISHEAYIAYVELFHQTAT
jgi:hypothetical protein